MGRRRNLRPDVNGVLAVDKPLGWSSAKVVAAARRVTGGAKVGHAGTLDPLATGVLVLCFGTATKAAERIQSLGKHYAARVDLSHFTTTDDAEGEPIDITRLVPAAFSVTPIDRVERDARGHPTQAAIERALAERFIGEIAQRPPDFSAVKVGGERAYRIARGGATPDIATKSVRIDAVTVLSYDWPHLELDIACGKGTYIRSLARDLGLALGVGGTLTALVRTAVGRWTVDDALPADDLDGAIIRDRLGPAGTGSAPRG
jgi:tRNA pseudouridine55 synthase